MPVEDDDPILEGGYSDPETGEVFDEYGNLVFDPEWEAADEDPFVDPDHWYPGPDAHMTAAGCAALAATYSDEELAKGLQYYQLRECQKHGESIKPKVPTFGRGYTLLAVGVGVAVLLVVVGGRR